MQHSTNQLHSCSEKISWSWARLGPQWKARKVCLTFAIAFHTGFLPLRRMQIWIYWRPGEGMQGWKKLPKSSLEPLQCSCTVYWNEGKRHLMYCKLMLCNFFVIWSRSGVGKEDYFDVVKYRTNVLCNTFLKAYFTLPLEVNCIFLCTNIPD